MDHNNANTIFEIHTYHWMPIAPNMLFQIKNNMGLTSEFEISDLQFTDKSKEESPTQNQRESLGKTDEDGNDKTNDKAIERTLRYKYKITNTIKSDNSDDEEAALYVRGEINGRGFVQHKVTYKDLSQVFPDASDFNRIITFEEAINSLLLKTLPERVINKLAVLEEKILSYDQYRTHSLEVGYITSAIRFIRSHSVTVIYANYDTGINLAWKSRNTTFYETFQHSKIYIRNAVENAGSFTRITQRPEVAILYLEAPPDNGDDDENKAHYKEYLQIMSEETYQYCALLIYARFLEIVIDVAGKLSHDLIAIRRQYLKDVRTADDTSQFDLIQQKKYMSYVTTKLTVLVKITSHLTDAYKSDEFSFKRKHFRDESLLLPEFRTIDIEEFQPKPLVRAIEDDFPRIDVLVTDTNKEAETLSSELNHTLSNELAMQRADLLDLQVETTRANVELARGGKNRANALKLLTMVTFGNIILGVFDKSIIVPATENLLFQASYFCLRNVFILALSSFALFGISFAEKLYRSQYELVIPLYKQRDIKKIRNLIDSVNIRFWDGNGFSRTRGWVVRIDARKKQDDLLEENATENPSPDDTTQVYESAANEPSPQIEDRKQNRKKRKHDRKKKRKTNRLQRQNVLMVTTRTILETNFNTFIEDWKAATSYQPFRISIKYNKNGYIQTITVGTEHFDTHFDTRVIVHKVCEIFREVLMPSEAEITQIASEPSTSEFETFPVSSGKDKIVDYPGSYVAEIFEKVKIDMVKGYPALNWILARSSKYLGEQLDRYLRSESVALEDRSALIHFVSRDTDNSTVKKQRDEELTKYVKYIEGLLDDADKLTDLGLEKKWLEEKGRILNTKLGDRISK